MRKALTLVAVSLSFAPASVAFASAVCDALVPVLQQQFDEGEDGEHYRDVQGKRARAWHAAERVARRAAALAGILRNHPKGIASFEFVRLRNEAKDRTERARLAESAVSLFESAMSDISPKDIVSCKTGYSHFDEFGPVLLAQLGEALPQVPVGRYAWQRMEVHYTGMRDGKSIEGLQEVQEPWCLTDERPLETRSDAYLFEPPVSWVSAKSSGYVRGQLEIWATDRTFRRPEQSDLDFTSGVQIRFEDVLRGRLPTATELLDRTIGNAMTREQYVARHLPETCKPRVVAGTGAVNEESDTASGGASGGSPEKLAWAAAPPR